MRPKTNRLLMLLVGAVISGCASQTDRSSSGGGAQTQTETAAPAPQPAPAPAYEPEKESVQYIDRPVDETPQPKPAAVAAAPKDEATPDFPITKYELPEDDEVEDLGSLEDESVSEAQEAAPPEASSIGETTEYAEDQQEEAQEAADSGEIEDLGPVQDDSGTMSFPEEKRAAADDVVGEPKIYADEPAPKPAPAVPKSISVNFEAEPLFNFDKSAIRADQRAKLDELISGLVTAEYDSISVIGHADHIGKETYNQKLSERRADAVKAYLIINGVPAEKILTEGRGESDPITGDTCKSSRGKALISCLQPDRRVDVSVSATKQVN